jgi:K+-sensing histidine kinase KdpD
VSVPVPGVSDQGRRSRHRRPLARFGGARSFDRFWRATAPTENGGFGLGLAIVRQLVIADGGEVELARSAGGGLEVVVRLRAGTDGSSRSHDLSR